MNLNTQLAEHLRQLCDGGNWTSVSLRAVISPIPLAIAQGRITAKESVHTIAELCYHCHYYIAAARRVLEGRALDANDAFSFQCPEFQSEAEWQDFKQQLFDDTVALAELIAALDDVLLSQDFVDAKYGSYYRNIQGTIEHTHYHLGQIVILKKLLVENVQ